MVFQKKDIKKEVEPKAKPELKAEVIVHAKKCECGKGADKGSHQCWGCAHRS